MDNWYESHDDVVAYARHLVEVELWDATQLLHYLEKPWKWTQERDDWAAKGMMREHAAAVATPTGSKADSDG